MVRAQTFFGVGGEHATAMAAAIDMVTALCQRQLDGYGR
jgi:hypothetical protein